MDTLLKVPQGKFELHRLPQRKNEKLRAWDAADEYILQHINDNLVLSISTKILILNDSFGALTVSLNSYKPIAISDSYLSQQATRLNLAANNLPAEDLQLKSSIDWPKQKVNLVLIKIPTTLALLEDQLIRLQTLLTAESIVIAAGMIKTMPPTSWKLLEHYMGPTKPSLARKKARLIFISLNSNRKPIKNPYPVYYQLENTPYQICNHANVFSREKLDIGTRFLLNHLPKNTAAKNIVDLGCGNGIVGILLAQSHPSATLFFADESYMAIASSKENFANAFPGRTAKFCIDDGLHHFKKESMDLIVCNPPFHQQNTVGNQIALSMFKQSGKALRKDGELWVIANRHLGYHIELNKQFRSCELIASNSKFVIWQTIK